MEPLDDPGGLRGLSPPSLFYSYLLKPSPSLKSSLELDPQIKKQTFSNFQALPPT